MTDLVTFLRERLSEEQDAAVRTQPGPWIAVPAPMPGEVEIRHQMPDGRPDVSAAVATTHGLHCAEQDADHIARYNPARALAELATKRAILDLHHPSPESFDHCAECLEASPCPTVRLLALPYAGHLREAGYGPVPKEPTP